MNDQPVPLILDTDIGDDVDDVLALAMAVNVKQIELLGVTTVHGDVLTRAKIAAKFLKVCGHSRPCVIPGEGHPLNQPPFTDLLHAQAQLVEGEDSFELLQPAVNCREFMAAQIRRLPHQVTIAAIGPLTNLARLLLAEPGLAEQIKEIVIMGGLFTKPSAEFNINMDPEAARIVFSSHVPVRVIPLEITEKCGMRDEDVERLMQDTRPAQQFIARAIRYWWELPVVPDRLGPILHDPLAIGAIACPELYQYRRAKVEVHLGPGDLRGLTVAVDSPDGMAQICTAVDYPRFMQAFLTAIHADAPQLAYC